MAVSPLSHASSALRSWSPLGASPPASEPGSGDQVALGERPVHPEVTQPDGSPRVHPHTAQVASVLGLAALSLVGPLVGHAWAGEAPAVTQLEAPGHTPAELLGPATLLDFGKTGNGSNPIRLAALETEPMLRPHQEAPKKAPVFLPLSRPSAQKGDYVRHHVNFSNLLSDAEFTRTDGVTTQDIQSYFERCHSFLARYSVEGRSAAEIVHQAAEKHQVNPWVVLATLEKESSMLSHSRTPANWLLRSAMGYAYDDGGSSAGRHSNFAYQVDKGTALLRQLFDQAQQRHFPARISVDYGSHKILVRNAATYALMMYTPHTVDTHLGQVGGGNYLFRMKLQEVYANLRSVYPNLAPS